MSDTVNPIAEAQAPGTFDVLSFLERTAYPTQKVVVYQDVEAAEEYVIANRARLTRDDSGDTIPAPEDDALTQRIEELAERIRKSAIVFSLRGLPPGTVHEIIEAEEGTDEEKDNRLIANTIYSVSNADGAVDPRVWDADMVAKVRKFLKEGEFGKLTKGVAEVNLNAAIFDRATDAGFSG